MEEAQRLRLGHAVRTGEGTTIGRADLEEVLEVLGGGVPLSARAAAVPTVVACAEALLGTDGSNRPVYAYLGDLHPGLGTIGLILDPAWLDRLVGVSRCDSGGLAGGIGGFAHVDEADRRAGVKELSTETSVVLTDAGWMQSFVDEVASSYSRQVNGYVEGEEPDVSAWGDVRGRCIEGVRGAGGEMDRRLWTWECRLGLPEMGWFVGLVLSEEGYVTLEELLDEGCVVPAHVTRPA